MRSLPVGIVLACLALAGCASAPRPDVRLPAAFEAPADATLSPMALDEWWTAFEDPQLTALIERALVDSPDVQSAAARLREARAARTGALTQFLPQGALTGQASRTETEQLEGTQVNLPGFSTSGTSENYQANFNVSWEVDLFGRLFAARRAANADVAAARFAYEGARASLAATLAEAYFQVRGLTTQLEDARETVRVQGALYRVAQTRAERGLAATSEADRVAGDLAQAESQAAALEAELTAARRTLLLLAGRGAAPLVEAPAPEGAGTIPPTPAALPGQLLVRRPDVREAEARLAGALGRRDYAQLAFFPTFTLTPGLGWSQVEQPGFSSTSQSWTIGGSVRVPVLDVPRLMAELRIEDARAEQAVIAYERAVQTAYGEAENALVQLDADRRRIALLAAGEARAARAYQAAQRGYAAGLTDLETALGAEQTWRATRAQLSAARVQGQRRAVQAFKALGGGWAADSSTVRTSAR